MSYKFDSLMIILHKLDSGERVTIQSLIDDLEVSERTVHRYLRTLQVAGYPVYFNRGKGSYLFVDGYTLGRPNLTLEESLAFALSKKLLKGLGSGMEKGLSSIEEKLSPQGAGLPNHIILKSGESSPSVDAHLAAIHQAILNYRKIGLNYRALSYDGDSVRTVDPYYLFFDSGFWYLRGFCNLREGLRTFALDRIKSLKILDKHFIPGGISPEEELSTTFGNVVDGELLDVVLRFDMEVRPYLLRKKWHSSQEMRDLDDGRVELRFTIKGFEGIRDWLYRWMPNVEIVKPVELKEAVKEELRRALKRI